jgi:hypothetical protein
LKQNKKTIAVLVGLASISIAATVAAKSDRLDRTFGLEDELRTIRDQAESESPQASAKALVRWLRKTSTEDIESVMEYNRSNLEGGVSEVIAAISSHGDHADALDAADELDRRLPNSEWHHDILAVKAKLNLRLGHVEEARRLAQEAPDVLCSCTGAVKEWLNEGTLPRAVVTSSPRQPWLFDERGSACEQSWATDKLDEFDVIDLIEGKAGVRTAAAAQLAAMWPTVVTGCVQTVDAERLQRLMKLGWTKQELSDGFAKAQQSVSDGSLKNIDLLGANLALPDQQCDFAADASCKSNFKPLSKDTAARLVDRLQPLSAAWSSTASAAKEPEIQETKEQAEARDHLADQYQKEMDEAVGLDATGGLARMRAILADKQYQHLGIFLNSYSFGRGLGRWSREGHAAEALQVFNLALDVGGPELQSSPSTPTALALLQLRSGEPNLALVSLEKRYAQSPSEEIAKTIGKLRAAIGGANLLQQYASEAVKRPWRYSSGWPICDFFSITGGLERIETVDLIVAFHGEREAALWQLAQEWPSVVGHCFDSNVWHEVRTRLQRVLGTQEFAKAVANAEESVELGSAPHFKFAGQELPLPDSESPSGSGDQSAVQLTRERLLQIIDETHLLKGCGRESSEHCN